MLLRLLLALVSTRDLQDALSTREGVTMAVLGLEDWSTFSVSGPCIVTVNRD